MAAITEDAIMADVHHELEEARKRKHSGRITVTIDINSGGIARAEINRGRPIGAAPQPGVRQEHMG